jgi:hypothetical protein
MLVYWKMGFIYTWREWLAGNRFYLLLKSRSVNRLFLKYKEIKERPERAGLPKKEKLKEYRKAQVKVLKSVMQKPYLADKIWIDERTDKFMNQLRQYLEKGGKRILNWIPSF